MNYYKKHIGDYYKKAGRLSLLQHGVYTTLIDACYDRERFPTKEEAIDWVWANSADELNAVDFILNKFFTLEDGVYVQDRIQDELQEFTGRVITNSINGKKGGRPKGSKNKPKETQSVIEETQSVNNKTEVKANESLTTNHKPITNNQEPINNNNYMRDTVRFPQEWTPRPDILEELEYEGIPIDYSQSLITDFIEYWREEEDSRSLNGWQITFRKHVRHQWGKYGKQWKG